MLGADGAEIAGKLAAWAVLQDLGGPVPEGERRANRAKAFSRVGMGRCQGRYCGHDGAEVVAAAAGIPVESVFPVAREAVQQTV